MLAKENRLKKKKDFETLFKSGKSKKEKFFILKFRKNGLPESRFAFIVSLKVSKKAVVRNKIRRVLSEAVRTNIGKIKKGYDFAFVALPGIEIKSYQEIKDAVLKCLEQ